MGICPHNTLGVWITLLSVVYAATNDIYPPVAYPRGGVRCFRLRRTMRAPVTTIRKGSGLRPGDLVTSSWASVHETTYCNSGGLHVNDFTLDRTTRVRAASLARLLPSEGTRKDKRGRVRRFRLKTNSVKRMRNPGPAPIGCSLFYCYVRLVRPSCTIEDIGRSRWETIRSIGGGTIWVKVILEGQCWRLAGHTFYGRHQVGMKTAAGAVESAISVYLTECGANKTIQYAIGHTFSHDPRFLSTQKCTFPYRKAE
ncbi:hypothetical protein EDB85DRAFT_1890759 [Lactarius pseudohatsudake]|nr:hypothetical protein EDB85DRAFT_1890759 [Lactarius pseudohatsudake]